MNKKEDNNNIKVGITHGDFNGVSYEVIINSLRDNRLVELFTPVIYGLSKVLAYYRNVLKQKDFNYNITQDASKLHMRKVNIVNLSNNEFKIEIGKSTKEAGSMAFKALEEAVKDIKENKIDVIVTAPLNKANIQSDDFKFPGHTEYLANQFGVENYLMLMVHNDLRVGTVTGHIPVKEISNSLNEELILSKLEVFNQSLLRDFGIQRPKIAVMGLNPHIGDKGLLGTEDEEIILPALIKAKKNGILAYGPFAADGFFGSVDLSKYDGVLAMYHDQGLAPFKTIAVNGGVNFTAGLPIVRTSPAHGTAYDIVGTGKSSYTSMREAIYLAKDIYLARSNYDEENSDPLPFGLFEKKPNNKKVEEKKVS
ncbi:MAG: 4-hydroxythreonine-4-phosphate dehydrogenase PdxA [Marinilabiliales bacterium]|nr:MAG: 4-hydroxythreonine-4-phosphate dehydrogenase PdxA [Marinilabiliales bacterium]